MRAVVCASEGGEGWALNTTNAATCTGLNLLTATLGSRHLVGGWLNNIIHASGVRVFPDEFRHAHNAPGTANPLSFDHS